MKRIIVSVVLSLAAAGGALAADLPQPAPPPRATYVPMAEPTYNWGGFYIGLNGGYGFGNSNWSASGGSTGSFSTDGFFIGGTFGANYEMNAFVLGVEVDGDWQDLGGSTAACATVFATTAAGGAAAPPGAAAGLSCQTKSDWLATARVRAGVAMDRILVFATGGAAAGSVEAGLTSLPLQSSTEWGWTVGAGVEVALTQNLSAKVEYLYVDLGSSGACNAIASCGYVFSATAKTNPPTNAAVSFTESVVRAGVNWKF